MTKEIGKKIIKLRTKTYGIIINAYEGETTFIGEKRKPTWTPYHIDQYGEWHRISLFTRGECNAFPKTVGYAAQAFMKEVVDAHEA